MKTLLVITPGYGRLDAQEMARREEADLIPRGTLLERRLEADVLYDRFPDATPAWRRSAYRLVPRKVVPALEAFFLRNRYDAIVSWAEYVTLPLALLLKLSGARTPHVAIVTSITQPRKAMFLRRVRSHVHRLLIQSSAQREFAVEKVGVDPARVVATNWYVDQKFWRPLGLPVDRISASGREMRDYGTLVRALKGLDVPCHVAAKVVEWKHDAWREDLRRMDPLPENVTIRYNESIVQVREHYARSRFVALPLLAADYELGSTVLLEAMAMGKPVVCTRVKGQRDILQDGKTGIFVPVGDVEGWRKAIRELWENPALAEEMGREARRQVEERFGFDDWVERVRETVALAVEEAAARPREIKA